MKLFRRAARHQALADLDTAIARSERPEQPIPAGSLIATRSGKLAHLKSASGPGALCEDMRLWAEWYPDRAPSLPLCTRCAAAAGIRSGETT
jgi:hypothetical protein